MSEASAPATAAPQNKYGIVYWATYGGFHVNTDVRAAYNEQRVKNGREPCVISLPDDHKDRYMLELNWDSIDRTDPDFVWVVKNSGIKTNLRVAYMDDRYDYDITEYDGLETVKRDKVKGCKCRCTCLDLTS